MKAKNMNELFTFLICILLINSVQSQNNVDILINSQKVKAQVENGQITNIDKTISSSLLNAISNPVVKDAQYYKELNDILDGKYGTYYAEVVKQELLALQSGKIVAPKPKLDRTAVVDIEDISVKFTDDTARLLGKSSEELIEFTEKLKTLNINFIMLEGHKETNDINDYILTTNRINTCKDYLIFNGIEADKIKTKILLTTSDEYTSSTVKITVK